MSEKRPLEYDRIAPAYCNACVRQCDHRFEFVDHKYRQRVCCNCGAVARPQNLQQRVQVERLLSRGKPE